LRSRHLILEEPTQREPAPLPNFTQPMGTDTAEMKLARLLPVSSINVRGSIRFRQPGRRSDWLLARSAQRPVATMHASKALNEPLAIAFLLPAARLPEHQLLQPDLRTGKHFLGRCARPRNRKVPACRAPSAFRSVAQLQERAISLPRLILIPRPPTAPALARIDKNRQEPFSKPALIGSQFNLWQGILLLGWAAALLAGPPPEVGELFKRKPG
jgi:hypothetical protein